MGELGKRILTATLLFAAAIAWLFYLPSPWFDYLLGGVGFLATIELLGMLAIPAMPAYALLAAVAWAMLVLGVGLPFVLLLLMIGWTMLFLLRVREGMLDSHFRQLAFGQWMLLWLMLFVWSVMQLHAREDGIWFIAGACLGVWGADIAAYFAGRRFGTVKLCPVVSPGKTIQGLWAALIVGSAVAAAVWHMQAGVPLFKALPLALLLVIVAVLGDLAESALKRAVGVKDSGRMLPGHGGLLDRIDALLPAVPAAGMLWMVWL